MATLLRTLNDYAGKYVELIFSAKKSAWVCSPWITRSYAEKLYDLSRTGVEVRIITSDDEYNADTYSYLSQLSSEDSTSTNFDVHFIKKDAVHSKIYVVDENYAVTGAPNFTNTGLNRQINNFTIAENQEVAPIANDFMKLWIGFKSEPSKVQPPPPSEYEPPPPRGYEPPRLRGVQRPQRPQPKYEILAGVLSLIFTGLGQIYNGQFGKAILFVIAGSVFLALATLYLFSFVLYAILWGYNIYDAVNTAKKINAGLITPSF